MGSMSTNSHGPSLLAIDKVLGSRGKQNPFDSFHPNSGPRGAFSPHHIPIYDMGETLVFEGSDVAAKAVGEIVETEWVFPLWGCMARCSAHSRLAREFTRAFIKHTIFTFAEMGNDASQAPDLLFSTHDILSLRRRSIWKDTLHYREKACHRVSPKGVRRAVDIINSPLIACFKESTGNEDSLVDFLHKFLPLCNANTLSSLKFRDIPTPVGRDLVREDLPLPGVGTLTLERHKTNLDGIMSYYISVGINELPEADKFRTASVHVNAPSCSPSSRWEDIGTEALVATSTFIAQQSMTREIIDISGGNPYFGIEIYVGGGRVGDFIVRTDI